MKKDMKDNTMIGAAVITLASGIILCFLSFFLDRQHEINSSVLWYFGQTLLYAASSFGLATYVKAKLNDVTNLIENDELPKRTFDSAIKNLKILCTQILEPARQRFGHPLTITSGFRCVKLNRIVGGQPNSYHLKGMAADIRISDFQSAKRLAELLNEQQLCDLVLVECSRAGGQWLHVQFSRNPRHKINLTYRV